MRSLWVIPLVAASSLASAGERVITPLVDAGAIDARCRALATVPRDADTPGPSLDAALSTASCLVSVRTRAVEPAPTVESRAELLAAVAPAMRIYDRVVAVGDPAHAVLALYAKSDVYDGLADRLMSSVPQVSPQITSREVYARDKQVGYAVKLTDGLRRRAADNRRRIAKLVVLHPELVGKRDPVLAYAIRKARIVDAAGVAMR